MYENIKEQQYYYGVNHLKTLVTNILILQTYKHIIYLYAVFETFKTLY